MDYNFNSPFTFSWPSGNGFMPNGYAPTTNAATTPAGYHGNQITTGVGLPQVFNNGVMFPGARFNGSGGFPFGINAQFNSGQNGPSMFNADWNYYVNRLPCFNTQVNRHDHITVPINNAVSTLGTSNIRLPSVTDVNVMQPVTDTIMSGTNEGMNAANTDSKSVNIFTPSSGKTENAVSSDLGEKSKDDITNEIALKVTSLLSNTSIMQGTISQMKGNTSADNPFQGTSENLQKECAAVQQHSVPESYVSNEAGRNSELSTIR